MRSVSSLILVGPIDRIIRFFVGLMILILAYILDFQIVEFAGLHLISIYFWLTMLIGWDPVYGIVNKIRNAYKDARAMNGNF